MFFAYGEKMKQYIKTISNQYARFSRFGLHIQKENIQNETENKHLFTTIYDVIIIYCIFVVILLSRHGPNTGFGVY